MYDLIPTCWELLVSTQRRRWTVGDTSWGMLTPDELSGNAGFLLFSLRDFKITISLLRDSILLWTYQINT